LRWCGAGASRDIPHWHAPASCDLASQQSGLIETPLPLPPPVKRHRDDHIKAAFARKHARQQLSERPGQRLNSLVLEQMDQLPQRALVGAERKHIVES
jgi:hypothetical protein